MDKMNVLRSTFLCSARYQVVELSVLCMKVKV